MKCGKYPETECLCGGWAHPEPWGLDDIAKMQADEIKREADKLAYYRAIIADAKRQNEELSAKLGRPATILDILFQ